VFHSFTITYCISRYFLVCRGSALEDVLAHDALRVDARSLSERNSPISDISHGTYLLARALLHYRAANSIHVVFVGSVVPLQISLEHAFADNRNRRHVDQILNYIPPRWARHFREAFQGHSRRIDLEVREYDGCDET